MKVYIQERSFGSVFDVYFVQDGPVQRIVRPEYVQDGEVVWIETEVPEGVADIAPSFRMTRAMLDALKEALRDNVVTVDEEMIRRLKLEESRVDRMLTYLMEGTH